MNYMKNIKKWSKSKKNWKRKAREGERSVRLRMKTMCVF